MTSPRRLAIALAALTFLTLGAAGCGVKGSDGAASSNDTSSPSTTTADSSPRTTEGSSSADDQDETTTTDGSSSDDEGPDETTPDSDMTVPDFSSIPDSGSIPDSIKDEMADAYTGMGLTKEQADCLVDAILDLGDPQDLDPSDMSDIQSMMGLFEDCNISLGDFDFGSGGFGQPDAGN